MQIGLKIISLLKVVRGVGAISVALSLLWASNQNLADLSELLSSYELLYALAKYTGLISGLASGEAQNNLLGLALLALLFGIIRFSEAIGIWFDKSWAEWLAVFTGIATAIYFLQRLIVRYELIFMIILMINILVVSYLLWVLLAKKIKAT